MGERTPWPQWLQAAQSLGIGPACFWRLSFREWRALSAPPVACVLSRADLQALTRRFPDTPHDR